MTRGVLSYRKFNLRTGLLSTSKTYSPDLCSLYSRPLKSRGCPCYRSGPLWSVNVFNKGVIRTEIRFLEIQGGKDVDVLRGPFHKLKKFSVISQMMINIFHQKSDILVKIFGQHVKVLRTDISSIFSRISLVLSATFRSYTVFFIVLHMSVSAFPP